jgi:hypothetical protein
MALSVRMEARTNRPASPCAQAALPYLIGHSDLQKVTVLPRMAAIYSPVLTLSLTGAEGL